VDALRASWSDYRDVGCFGGPLPQTFLEVIAKRCSEDFTD
jgi:hypothetical protein